nr:MAG TPA: hypothetical protein [Bacteriophage sp.]
MCCFLSLLTPPSIIPLKIMIPYLLVIFQPKKLYIVSFICCNL